MSEKSKKLINAVPPRGKSPRAAYDVVEEKNARHRRKAAVEMKGEDAQLPNHKRSKLISLGRDLERNYNVAKGHLRQFRLNVVGVGPKMHMNIEDDAAKAAADWFNGVYAKNCDARDDTPLNEICMNILTAVKREGDIVVAFDNFHDDDGKLFFWESDQLCGIDDKEWKKQKEWIDGNGLPLKQSDGVVYDKMGKIKAFIVSDSRAPGKKKLDEVTILPAGSTAKLLKFPWRFNQRRGTPDISAAIAHYLDSYEMQSSELQSGKLASKIAGKIKRSDAVEEILAENGLDMDDYLSTTTTAGEESAAAGEAPPNYERFEALTGGYLEYLKDDDDFEILDFNRPNVNASEFIERINVNNGASLGLAKVYSTMTASTAYTAFRGEMLLSWAQFYVDQKWLERRFMDWLAVKAINWAVKRGILARPADGWESKISFSWPTMPVVDPLKLEMSVAKALKTGRTDFAKLLGPGWRGILQAYAEQIREIRGLELPLEVLETKSGGVAPTKNDDKAAATLWEKIKGIMSNE